MRFHSDRVNTMVGTAARLIARSFSWTSLSSSFTGSAPAFRASSSGSVTLSRAITLREEENLLIGQIFRDPKGPEVSACHSNVPRSSVRVTAVKMRVAKKTRGRLSVGLCIFSAPSGFAVSQRAVSIR